VVAYETIPLFVVFDTLFIVLYISAYGDVNVKFAAPPAGPVAPIAAYVPETP
jgi:hypothetical protein